MNLRVGFPHLQHLFVITCAFVWASSPSGRADVVTLTDGRRQEVRVVDVVGPNLRVQIGAGTMGLPLSSVKEVQMPAPPEFTAAMQAIAARENDKAKALLSALSVKFKGLPADWAQQAAGALADLYVTVGDYAKAEEAYKENKVMYPKLGSLQSDVGMGRILIVKRQFDQAKAKLEPIAADALKDKSVSRSNGATYGQVFLSLGELKEKQGDLPGALESYLRTVTVFNYDAFATTQARTKADALIAQKVMVP